MLFTGVGAVAHSKKHSNARATAAPLDLRTGDFGGVIRPAERDMYERFAFIMEYESMVLLANAQSNYNTLYPPTGYVATVRADSIFQSDAFVGLHNLFRGVAWVKVQMDTDLLSDVDRKVMRRRLNLLVRDKSPHPPRRCDGHILAKVNGGWAPSLGKCGWLGLYCGRTHDPRGDEVGFASKDYYLAVVAGLDEETYGDLDREMNACSGKSATVGSMFEPGGILEPYRQLAAENRRRLLALAVNAMQLRLLDAAVEEHETFYEYLQMQNPDLNAEMQCHTWLRLGPARIPATFRMPQAQPRDVPEAFPEALRGFELGRAMESTDPRVQRRPTYVSGKSVFDTGMNDVLPLVGGEGWAGLMGVYMGAAATTARNGVPYTTGPCGIIKIFNLAHNMGWENPRMFNAFPSEAIHSFDPTARVTVDLTWERADLAVNRNAGAWFYADPVDRAVSAQAGGIGGPATAAPVKLRDRYGSPCAEAISLFLEPMLVRVSAKDPLDLATAPEFESMKFGNIGVDKYEGI